MRLEIKNGNLYIDGIKFRRLKRWSSMEQIVNFINEKRVFTRDDIDDFISFNSMSLGNFYAEISNINNFARKNGKEKVILYNRSTGIYKLNDKNDKVLMLVYVPKEKAQELKTWEVKGDYDEVKI